MVSNPFREALTEVAGDSWLDDLARESLRAAEAKFSTEYLAPALLRLTFTGLREVDAHDSSLATKAIQDATAKLAHMIRNPGTETNMAHAASRAKAPLLVRSQAGNAIVFGFPAIEEEPPGKIAGTVSDPLAFLAARELVTVLPASADDDAALDAVLAQRPTVRNAVGDIVQAMPRKGEGLGFLLTPSSGEAVSSMLSRYQASVLKDSLKETRIDRSQIPLRGRLDGIRTKRRIFYLDLPSGAEIHGAVDLESLDEVRANLDRQVTILVERERIVSVSGRRTAPFYRLISFLPSQESF